MNIENKQSQMVVVYITKGFFNLEMKPGLGAYKQQLPRANGGLCV